MLSILLRSLSDQRKRQHEMNYTYNQGATVNALVGSLFISSVSATSGLIHAHHRGAQTVELTFTHAFI